jgi:hypothetical protein
LANVIAGVSATTVSEPDVQIGSAAATLGNITVTEAAAGNIASTAYNAGLEYNPVNESSATNPEYLTWETKSEGTAYLDITAPVGVTFETTPTVTVTSGNIQIGTVTTTTTAAANQGVIQIAIKASSTTASTLEISNVVATIDRTVPEGPVTFDVDGTAVDQTELGTLASDAAGDGTTLSALYPNDTNAVQFNVANVATGVNGSTYSNAVFQIGQTSYTLNGTTVNMDVAPYIKDNRTFVPLRYVANALGVTDSDVLWDPIAQKVTIIKGSLVAQFAIGSTTMTVNGAAIAMDAAPEITDSRTCLPIAWAAQALGVQYTWDATAQTVTFNAD